MLSLITNMVLETTAYQKKSRKEICLQPSSQKLCNQIIFNILSKNFNQSNQSHKQNNKIKRKYEDLLWDLTETLNFYT